MIFVFSPSSPPHRVARAKARVVLLTVLVGLGMGQDGAGASERRDSIPSWAPGEDLEQGVRESLSQQWDVPGDALVLEWGEPRGGRLREGLTRVQLLGNGRDGRFVASFGPENGEGESQSVLLRAGALIPRLVAARAMERGEVIGDEDMELENLLHWGSPEGLPAQCEVGWVVQRPIKPREILTAPVVKPPLLVISGRPVTVLWSRGKVDVRLRGRAAGSASLGERVFIRTETGTRLDALVEGPGLVRIPGHTTESGR